MNIDTAFAAPLMKRDDETLTDYWLSFSPAAPFFGVPYRFADIFKPAALSEFAPQGAFAIFSFAKGETAAPAEAPVVMPDDAADAVEEAEEIVAELGAVLPDAAEEVVETVAAPEAAPEADLFAAPAAGPAAPAGLFDAAPAAIDDLKLLKGVGPKLEVELNGLGIYTFKQIAEMSEENLHWIDEQISSVRGRPMRDDWRGQAKALAGL